MSSLDELWALRNKRPLFVAVTVTTLVILFVYPAVDWWLRSIDIASEFAYGDFGAYRGAVSRWQEGTELYRRADDGGFHGTFLYPPVVIILFVPFKGMDFAHAVMAWNLFSLGLLWIGMQLLITALEHKLQIYERIVLLWGLVGFHPLLLSMKLGQMAPFLAAFLCFSAVALIHGEDGGREFRYLSGICTAIVGVIKLSYAPVGAHLLHNRDRLLGAVGVGVVLVAVSLLVFGIDAHRTYLEVLKWGFNRGADSRPPTLWLPPYYRPLHWLPNSQWLRIGASVVVAGSALFAANSDAKTVFALGVSAFPLLTPHAYTYYFVALLPAVMILLAVEFDRNGYMIIPVVGLLLVHLHAHGLKFVIDSLPALFPEIEFFAPYWLLQPGLWGNLLLVGLAFSRIAQGSIWPAVQSSGPEWVTSR